MERKTITNDWVSLTILIHFKDAFKKSLLWITTFQATLSARVKLTLLIAGRFLEKRRRISSHRIFYSVLRIGENIVLWRMKLRLFHIHLVCFNKSLSYSIRVCDEFHLCDVKNEVLCFFNIIAKKNKCLQWSFEATLQ